MNDSRILFVSLLLKRIAGKPPATQRTRGIASKKVRPGFVMDRIQPVTKKIDSDEFRSLFTPQLKKLSGLFDKNHYELRIAGGAARDLLMGIRPSDVDFATTATPTQMKEVFEREGIRMLHMRGEEHGTITCRLDDAENFEVTTLRVDVVCDGRRAEVEYTTDWQLDANRRDLTINSMFLGFDGTLYDYFGGIVDCQRRRVAFVGDAAQRIQEDYLRILRYFRFFGRISNSTEHERETIDAIVRNKDGLKGVSAERIWTEMKKIVVGRMAPQVMQTMLVDCGLNAYLGLPQEVNLKRFKNLFDQFEGKLEPMTLVASLCEHPDQIDEFHRITKLSNEERLLGEFVIAYRQEAGEAKADRDWWIHKIVELEGKPGHDNYVERARKRVLQLARSVFVEEELVASLEEFKCPVLPVTGVDLMGANVKRGPRVRFVLLYLFDLWKQSDYKMGKEELLEHAHDAEIPEMAPPAKKKKSPS